MRVILNINREWTFVKNDCGAQAAATAKGKKIDLPYTWNGKDGQSGGGYLRGAFWFVHNFKKPELDEDELAYIEFKGVNSSTEVWLNGQKVCEHHGGYSTFRAEITPYLQEENSLCVRVDNSANEKVYPQTADFTFYGGIYRDVNLIIVNKNHFDLEFYGSSGLKIQSEVNGKIGTVTATAYIKGEGEVKIAILDSSGATVAEGENGEKLTVNGVRRWNGIEDPYLYTACAELFVDGESVDYIEQQFGFRTFEFHPKKGFILNGEPYPLHGVARHQDRPKTGNALSIEDHEEDMLLIKEIGANAVRLAHYQHDDYFYDLCDENGMVVWAEIPCISRYMPEADDNAISQMKELIYQQYNHPCIVTWSIANEITMCGGDKQGTVELLKKLNSVVKETDPSRPTALACYAKCGFNDETAQITDIVGWNLYFGWYTPWLFLNKIWLKLFRLFRPKLCLGLSEYGAEGMPNLHSAHPKRGDNSEEYQAKYHEYMLAYLERNPSLWGSFVWNMFDFASDERNQGGEAGMNHKGLVTFDRQTKKDAFYICKAYWSKKPFIKIAGKRFKNRTGKTAEVTVYTNTGKADLIANGKHIKGTTKDGRAFKFKINLEETTRLRAVSGDCIDECEIKQVKKPDPAYKLNGKSK